LTARPDVGMAEIAQVLERDPAMSGKVLQLVNSAFFGTVQKSTTVQRAASYLGTELIKSLVLTTEAFGSMGDQNHQLIEEVQLDAMKTAQLARKFLQGRPEAEAAMTAALLHDIGKLVVATGAPHLYAACQNHPQRATRSILEIEKEIYGASHAEVGAYLLGVWGVPFVTVEAVAHHHQPASVTSGDRTVLAAVHAAALLVDGRGDELDLKFLEAAGYTGQLPRWKELAAEAAR
jgi:putative nucleotidyltransferase with HDIG domain